MTKKVKVPKASVGYGFVGAWNDNSIGWGMPGFLSSLNTRHRPERPDVEERPYLSHARLYLCKITVKPLLDKRGRPITRFAEED